MAAGTILLYNGVKILNCVTTQFDQAVVRDSSETDQLYHKITLSVTGQVHGVANFAITGVQSTVHGDVANMPNQMNAVSQLLLEDRQTLDYYIEGDGAAIPDRSLVYVLAHPGNLDGNRQLNKTLANAGNDLRNYDVHNGPKPISFRVTKVVGRAICEVEYTIEVAVVRCYNAQQVNGVLSNRWSVHDVIDQNWMTTRTYTGKLVTANAKINPDAFRGWVVPPLALGFRRMRIETTTAENGCELSYTIEDVQTTNAPPLPATSWSGTHKLSTAQDESGIHNQVDIEIHLEGPEGASKDALIALACDIAVAKTNFSYMKGQAPPQQIKVMWLSRLDITDHLETNAIDLGMTVKITPQQITAGMVAALGIGGPLDIPKYDRLKAPVPGIYGTATTTGRFICYLQTPCDDTHKMPLTNNASFSPADAGNPGSQGAAGTAVVTYTGSVDKLTKLPTPLDDAHRAAQYTMYRIDNDVQQPENRVACPIARSSQGDGDSLFVARLAPRTGFRIIKVEAERLGAWPQIPDGEDYTDENGIQLKIMDQRIIDAAPTLSADGVNFHYAITAKFVYAMNRSLKKSDKIPTAKLPWVQQAVADAANKQGGTVMSDIANLNKKLWGI